MELIKCFLCFISIYPALSIVPRKDFHEKINQSSDLSTNQLFLPFRKNKLDNSVLQSSIISQYLDKNSLDADDMIILARILNHSYYYGDWKTLDNNRVPEFSNQNGHTFMYYDSMAKYTVDLHLYDGDYVDNKVLTIMYNYKDESYFYKKENATLEIYDVEVIYQIGRIYGDLGVPQSCLCNISMYFINKTSFKPFVIDEKEPINPELLGFQVRFKSQRGPLNLITSTLTKDDILFDSQALLYVIIVSTFAITQCVVLYYFDRSINKKPYLARRTSSWSLVVLNAFDLYFFLSTSYFFMSYSPWYELCAIPCAFLAFCFEPKVTWNILQVQREISSPRNEINPEIKTYFCMLILFLGVLGSLVVFPDFAYLLSVFFLMPQITHNAHASIKYKWNYWILGGLTFPKLLFTLYSKLDPYNLLRTSPNPVVVIIYFSLLSFQLILLAIQTKWPKFGFEEKPIYSVYSTKSSKTNQDLCAICLEKLKDSFANSSPSTSFIKTDTTLKDLRKILTPCNHEFHLTCLGKWLESKLECPYCRKDLPLLPEEYLED